VARKYRDALYVNLPAHADRQRGLKLGNRCKDTAFVW